LIGDGERGQQLLSEAFAYSAAASTGARLSLGWQVSPGAK
jgi:hypothetical protein